MKDEFLNSKEAMKFLKISSCDLMHARELEELDFVKKGNAFMYTRESLQNFKLKEKRKPIHK